MAHPLRDLLADRLVGLLMSDAVIVALFAAIPATVAAIAGVVNSFKANGIHKLVNSQLTALKAELVAAQVKIEELQDLVVKLTSREMDP